MLRVPLQAENGRGGAETARTEAELLQGAAQGLRRPLIFIRNVGQVMREITYCGLQVKEHPTLGVLVREDGAVWLIAKGQNRSSNPKYAWNYGWLNRKYRYVSIDHKQRAVHRLVAECFIPNIENKPTVDHIDRNSDNNHYRNLRWATMEEQERNQDRYDKCEQIYGFHPSKNNIEYQRARRRLAKEALISI